MNSLTEIEKELASIKERNVKVEADKAWEKSIARTLSILAITYAIASLTLYGMGNERPFLNALIPVIGYFLSIQSIPFLKRAWLTRYFARRTK